MTQTSSAKVTRYYDGSIRVFLTDELPSETEYSAIIEAAGIDPSQYNTRGESGIKSFASKVAGVPPLRQRLRPACLVLVPKNPPPLELVEKPTADPQTGIMLLKVGRLTFERRGELSQFCANEGIDLRRYRTPDIQEEATTTIHHAMSEGGETIERSSPAIVVLIPRGLC